MDRVDKAIEFIEEKTKLNPSVKTLICFQMQEDYNDSDITDIEKKALKLYLEKHCEFNED